MCMIMEGKEGEGGRAPPSPTINWLHNPGEELPGTCRWLGNSQDKAQKAFAFRVRQTWVRILPFSRSRCAPLSIGLHFSECVSSFI